MGESEDDDGAEGRTRKMLIPDAGSEGGRCGELGAAAFVTGTSADPGSGKVSRGVFPTAGEVVG
jgi:hypothetical protein